MLLKSGESGGGIEDAKAIDGRVSFERFELLVAWRVASKHFGEH